MWFTQSDASVRAGIIVAEVPSLAAFPTLHWTCVVLGCDPDVVRAVGMGFLASSLYAGAGSLRPDVIHVPQKALHPNSPERGACAPLGLGLLMRRFFPRWHWLEGGVTGNRHCRPCGLLSSSVSLFAALALGPEGVSEIEKQREEENEPRFSSWFVIWTHCMGLPIPGSPLLFFPPQIPPLGEN